MGVLPHHLQKHNKRTKETTYKQACGGEWKGREDWGGRKIAAFAKKGGQKKEGQGVGQGAGLPMGVPPHHLQKPNKRTKETTYKQACVVSTALLLLSVPRAGLEPAQPSLAKGF